MVSIVQTDFTTLDDHQELAMQLKVICLLVDPISQCMNSVTLQNW